MAGFLRASPSMENSPYIEGGSLEYLKDVFAFLVCVFGFCERCISSQESMGIDCKYKYVMQNDGEWVHSNVREKKSDFCDELLTAISSFESFIGNLVSNKEFTIVFLSHLNEFDCEH